MEVDGEVEEEQKHGDRIPELAKDRKGEAKARKDPEEEEDVERPRERHSNRFPVTGKAKGALTVEMDQKYTRSAASKICRT